jgi:hypothetical protein
MRIARVCTPTCSGPTFVQRLPSVVYWPAAEAWVNGITIDMSSISAVNNNPQFGVRIVSAYAPDGPNAGQYVNLAGNVINSTSGNWRLDSVTFSGNAIPEPSSVILIGLGVAACAMLRRGRKVPVRVQP